MTQLVADRNLALRVGYAATDWTHPIAFTNYEQLMSDWDVRAVMKNDQCIGAVYFRDGEVHVSILPEWRKKWATKGLLKQILGGDSIKTRVTPGHEYMHDVLKRLGFREQNDFFVRGH